MNSSKEIKKLVWKKQIEARGSSWKVKGVALSENDLLVLGSNADEQSSHLFICDLKSLEWSTAPLSGDGPCYSDYYYPLISEENDGMLVFWTSKEKGVPAILIEDYLFDEILLKKGETIYLLEHDPDNEEMIICLYESEIMELPKRLFVVEEENSSFDLFERSELVVSFLNFANGMQWSRIIVGNDESPKARRDFSCTKIDQKIFVFGGVSDNGVIHNDMYILDLVELKWTKCNFTSEEDKPPARYGHSATVLDSEYILVFGGNDYEQKFNDLYLFNIFTEEWSLLEIEDCPSARSYHSFVRFKEYIILFGGEGEETILNDLYILDIEESRWVKIENTISNPAPRFKHFCGLFSESLVFFGGENGSENLFDIYTLFYEDECGGDQEKSDIGSPNLEMDNLSVEISLDNETEESLKEDEKTFDAEPEECKFSNKSYSDLGSEVSFGRERELEKDFEIQVNDEMTQASIEPELVYDLIPLSNDFIMQNEGNEVIIEFDSHEFIVEESEPTYMAQIEESDVLEDIFRSISQGGLSISLCTFLKICRNCRIIENWLCYDSILESVSNILLIKEFNGEELIDCYAFRRITSDISQKRNKKIQDLTFSHIQLIENLLKPYYKTVGNPDDLLDEFLSPDVISLFSSKKSQLQELFAVYSCLTLNSVFPETKELMKSNNSVSLSAFLSFAETFDITPYKISRVSLQKSIFYNSLPPEGTESFKESKSKSLNYPQFLESLCRIAIHIYSQHPYSSLVKTTKEKIEVFFNHLGFKDSVKFKEILKKAGIGGLSFSPKKIPNKEIKFSIPSGITRQKADSLNEKKNLITDELRRQYADMMQNKYLLKDELEKVFMYYCSFGNRMNLDLMSSSKFKMFIRDTNIYKYGFKQEEADLIFVKVLSITKKKSNSTQKLSFPLFVDCVKEIASKLRREISPSKAFAQFLLIDVLPNVHRLESQNNLDYLTEDEPLIVLLEKFRKNLQKLFFYYCNLETQSKETMSCNNLFKLCLDFELVPLVSKKLIFTLFRSHTTTELIYPKFENCLVELVQAAYDKYPYNIKHPSRAEKVGAFFQKMELEDWTMIRKRLDVIQ